MLIGKKVVDDNGGGIRICVSDIDVKPPVPVTCTLYSTSVTVIEVVFGRFHIKLTLLDSVVEFLRLVGPGSTTRMQRNDIINSYNIFAYHHHCRLLL